MRDLALLLAAAAILAQPSPAASDAATGAIRGTAVDAATERPLFAASVRITSRRNPAFHVIRLTDRDGAFQAGELPEGPYEIRGSHVGYLTFVIDVVDVEAGREAVVSLALAEEPMPLKTMIVSASRREEMALDAPASVQVIETEEIENAPVLTPADHLRGRPAVDVARSGLSQGTVVVRGFNNVFSGATLTLVDNRVARLPSLQYNAMNLIPTLNEEIDRIEVVSGPGSALYGPNAANGVIHVITRSPFDAAGTSVSIGGGERDVLMGTLRHAGAPNEKLGYRIGVHGWRGDDFETSDPVEDARRAAAIAAGADPDTLKVGVRDFDTQKLTVDAGMEIRPDPELSVTLSGGYDTLDAIELTGLGATQADGFSYGYGQARVQWRRFFWQAYLNRNDSGDTYNLRTGAPLVDRSVLFVTQGQHRWSPAERQTFTYGADLLLTRPDTEGTINGRNEQDDDINEIGGYLQSETHLNDRWSVTAAARVDHHDRLDDPVFSPRAAVVFGPSSGHKLRGTYNRAYATPAPNNLFLDLRILEDLGNYSADLGGLYDGYDVHSRGVPEGGFRFRRDSQGGIDGLYMQSPEVLQALGAPPDGAADATLTWAAVQQVLLSQGTNILGIPAPGPAQVESRLGVPNLDPSAAQPYLFVGPDYVQDIQGLKPTINNTFELGYKGVVGKRFTTSVDVWHSRIKDFVGPLRVETPNVFFDPVTLAAYLEGFGLTPTEVQSYSDAIASIPVGTVTPENAADPADLLLTYRNFGDVDLTGVDLALEWLAYRHWTLGTSYSYVSKDFFRDASAISDIALNAPRHKAAAHADYRDAERGLEAGLRVRFVDTFPVLSGVFVGEVDWYTVADLSAAAEIPWVPGTSVALLVQNLFDNVHREFVGAPELRRMSVLRVTKAW